MNYEDIKALNWSTLKHIHRSPLYYRYAVDHPEPRKEAFESGLAIHCAVLEPEEFETRYAVCSVRRNKRDKAYQEWLEENTGKAALKQDDWDRAHRAADAVWSHREAKRILSGCRHEESLVWTDADTGLRCKGRLDAIGPEYFADLKMARDITPRGFSRAAASYLYHGQMAHYQAGAADLKKIDGKTPPYIVAVEADPPHDVAAYQLSLDDLAAGRELVLSLMQKLIDCETTGMWPGVAPDLLQLNLPPWAPGGAEPESEEW